MRLTYKLIADAFRDVIPWRDPHIAAMRWPLHGVKGKNGKKGDEAIFTRFVPYNRTLDEKEGALEEFTKRFCEHHTGVFDLVKRTFKIGDTDWREEYRRQCLEEWWHYYYPLIDQAAVEGEIARRLTPIVEGLLEEIARCMKELNARGCPVEHINLGSAAYDVLEGSSRIYGAEVLHNGACEGVWAPKQYGQYVPFRDDYKFEV